MRGWMNEGKSYIAPVALGQVMRALGVGEVIASKHPDFKPGDHVNGPLGVQDYFVGEPQGLYKIDPRLAPAPLPLSPGHDRHDRLLRPARRRPTQGR